MDQASNVPDTVGRLWLLVVGRVDCFADELNLFTHWLSIKWNSDVIQRPRPLPVNLLWLSMQLGFVPSLASVSRHLQFESFE